MIVAAGDVGVVINTAAMARRPNLRQAVVEVLGETRVRVKERIFAKVEAPTPRDVGVGRHLMSTAREPSASFYGHPDALKAPTRAQPGRPLARLRRYCK